VNLWGGRFREAPAESLKRFNDSFSFDVRLLEEDVRGSIAWAAALRQAGVLTAAEEQEIAAALAEIPSSLGVPAGPTGIHAQEVGEEAEDVHSWVEIRLRQKVGPLAGKLHTGRSRNDQVATDLKLFLRDAFSEAREHTLSVTELLADIAEREAGTIMPGYTHLQQAELITFGHWALAYTEMLLRDADRLACASARGDECPLGSGALAGTPLPIDRHALASALGFARPTANSLDAVSDRDAATDYLYAAAMLFGHLSRLAEDLILFSTQEFGFVELPDAYATGSSRMPQKKNPDVLELVRGHAGRLIGELTGLLALLKGLPLAYNKDLQLDKEPVFRTRDLVAAALPALAGLLRGLKVNHDVLRRASNADALLATQLADAMTRRGVAFRKAHEIVGQRLIEAQTSSMTLRELGPSNEITTRDLEALDLDLAVARTSAWGGTAPARVRAAAAAARERIADARDMPQESIR
jgi:argininosuccinate lyase